MMKYLLIAISLLAFITSAYRGPDEDVMGQIDGVPYDY